MPGNVDVGLMCEVLRDPGLGNFARTLARHLGVGRHLLPRIVGRQVRLERERHLEGLQIAKRRRRVLIADVDLQGAEEIFFPSCGVRFHER